jgi:hypothetical protein
MIGFNHLGAMGQLGNQMFQYAALKGISRNIGTSCVIPNHKNVIVDSFNNQLRIELFDYFEINPDKVGVLNTDNYIQEKKFEFDETFFELSSEEDVSLIGYFQTEKYFSHIEDEIRSDFSFKDEIVSECAEYLEFFDNPIALHIRRGDYILNSKNHNNLGLDYYETALSKFSKNRQVIIFSDDPSWCKEQDLFLDDRFLISDGSGSQYDLYLMSKCNDFIIANSTFSWWGAWLANTGKVIAPSKWFGPNNIDKNTKDLYCEGWIVL